jgi:endoglucanase
MTTKQPEGRGSWTGLGLAIVVALAAAVGGVGNRAHANPTGATSAAHALDAYPPMPARAGVVASPAARAAAAALSRGINFGNMLESPREGDWGLRADDAYIELVGGAAGLTQAVRLPVRWSNHASADAQALIDPVFMARVESVVNKLLARGVTVVLNMHHYRQLEGNPLDPNEKPVPAEVVQPRFFAMWKQIAERFSGAPPRLLFELYNEPHGAMEPLWNDFASRALRVVRASNPTRVVVIGPHTWNSASALPQLVLPADPNLVLTVHNYEPFTFTHQGAEWVNPRLPVGVDCCDAAQLAKMREMFDLAVSEARRVGYPVFVGEFGAYEKAPLAARVRYLRAFRQMAEERDLPWMYWELASGFGLYDPVARRFRPALKDALFGPR